MTQEEKESKRFNLNIHSQFTSAVMATGVVLSSISLVIIAIRLGPIAQQAFIWTGCVNTTGDFLSGVPGFESIETDGIEAMSVSLCNGSTPQKEKNTPDKK